MSRRNDPSPRHVPPASSLDPTGRAAPDHESWLADAELHALGALDGVERLRMLAHIAEGCAACRHRIERVAQVLRRLDPAASPRSPDPKARARLLAAVRERPLRNP